MQDLLLRMILYTTVPTLCQIEHNETEEGQNLLRIFIIAVVKAFTSLYFGSSFKDTKFFVACTKCFLFHSENYLDISYL